MWRVALGHDATAVHDDERAGSARMSGIGFGEESFNPRVERAGVDVLRRCVLIDTLSVRLKRVRVGAR